MGEIVFGVIYRKKTVILLGAVSMLLLGIAPLAFADEFAIEGVAASGSDFNIQLNQDKMLLSNTQYFPNSVSLDQAKEILTSTILPTFFSRSVTIKKMVRNRINPTTVELITYAEKEMMGITFDITTYATCTETAVEEDGWKETCALNPSKGDAGRVFYYAYSSIHCTGRNAPTCVQTLDSRLKKLGWPASVRAKELAISGAMEALHVAGASFVYSAHSGMTPPQARSLYDQGLFFSLVEKIRPLLAEAKGGGLDSASLTILGSDRSGSFQIIRN